MKINVKEVGVAEDGKPALDTNGNKLPIGEYEVDLVYQYKGVLSDEWANENKNAYKHSFEEYTKESKLLGSEVETRQVYIASVDPEQTTDIIDDWGNCNGCGIKVSLPEVAYTNNEGCDYCADCNEAIQGDPESAAGLIDTEVDTIEQWVESVEEAAENFSSETLHGFLSPQYQGFIAGSEWKANHIKSTHVPIEEVERIISDKVKELQDKEERAKNSMMSGHYDSQVYLLEDLLIQIRSLITPQ